MSFFIILVDISVSYVAFELSRCSQRETPPEPYYTFKMDIFPKIVNDLSRELF